MTNQPGQQTGRCESGPGTTNPQERPGGVTPKGTPQMKNRSMTAEQWITTWTETFELQAVDIADIDRVKSQHVQNRSAIKLDDDNVLEMMVWLDTPGHVLPPVILNRVGRKFYIIDGNHRVDAHARMDRVQVEAYVVEVDQDDFEGMVMAANARMGKSLTPKERVDLALAMETRFGIRIAAEQMLMKPEDLQREKRIQGGRRLVEEVKDMKVDHWSKKKLEALNRLDADHLRSIDKDVLAQATATETEQMVKNILFVPRSQQTEEARRQAEHLREEKKSGATPRKRVRGIATERAAKKALGDVAAYLRANPAALNNRDLRASVEDLQALVERILGGRSEHAA